jgi:peptidoglycan hydrolase CwlO-like protein
MSTAGKVLVVVFLLTSLIWTVLASGVSQLNTNYNTKLHNLTVQVEKLAADVEQSQDEVVALNNQISSTQEQNDREYALLRAIQSDVQREHSQIQETLLRNQYQLATVEETIKTAQIALEHRNTEQQAETTALAQSKTDVQTLMGECGQLMDRLTALRKDFQTKYHANVEMVGKLSRAQDGQRGTAN